MRTLIALEDFKGNALLSQTLGKAQAAETASDNEYVHVDERCLGSEECWFYQLPPSSIKTTGSLNKISSMRCMQLGNVRIMDYLVSTDADYLKGAERGLC